MTIAREDPSQCAHCGSEAIHQDNDVLDTWFSSGLWPFSTLGWPDHTGDLAYFYPTSLMITGFDILFFWVARMIMLGIEMTGDVPFRQVHIHGLVRDADRQKMSKTKGNTVDPLTINERYGTDATRLALVLGAASGMDIAFTPERLDAARAFANKIWNAARFLFTKMEAAGVEPWISPEYDRCIPEPEPATLEAPVEDRWIFSRLNHAAESVNRALEQHRYHEAADTLWHFFKDEFCDWYIELKKLKLVENTGLNAHWRNILNAFERSLRLLHPIMPFLTEELWQRLAVNYPDRPKSIALAQYPQYNAAAHDLKAEIEIQMLQDIVTAARALRADHKVDKKLQLPATLYVTNSTTFEIARREMESIERIANIKVDLKNETAPELKGATRSTPEFDLFLQLPETDSSAVRIRLGREIEQLEKLIVNSERQLNNEEFVKKAPEKVVTQIREKMAGYQAQADKSRATLSALQ